MDKFGALGLALSLMDTVDIGSGFGATYAFLLCFFFYLRLIGESHAHVADDLDVVGKESAGNVHVLPWLIGQSLEQSLFAANAAFL